VDNCSLLSVPKENLGNNKTLLCFKNFWVSFDIYIVPLFPSLLNLFTNFKAQGKATQVFKIIFEVVSQKDYSSMLRANHLKK
jgi:hypothetical protein